ncbi:glycosyltransferase [Rubinisphaera sp. JC750]|uniref:glycosyltransferase n=1 Tax=Rubinisphaera sp. JC750 TaxID=2898658 RepID=UPI001F19B23F|nr:glycosyltransferase [Rubinisphaera sp. JC750]
MKVLHLSTYDVSGGAAIAAYRLHKALQNRGIDSRMLVARKQSEDDSVRVWPCKQASLGRFQRWISERQRRRFRNRLAPIPAHAYFNGCRSSYRFSDVADEIHACDVIHLHWVANFLDWPETLPQLAAAKPLVWTLHDHFPLSGIWHYPPDGPVSGGLHRFNQQVFEEKLQAATQIPTHRLRVVSPSNELHTAALKSSVLGRFRNDCIFHAVDTNVFRPVEQRTAREALNLPVDATIVAFLADNLREPRKGSQLLVEALPKAGHRIDLLLTAGKGSPLQTGIPSVHLGPLRNERLLAMFYSAADLFICPSTQEAFGLTALESLACGTPVVGFRVGGIPDLVDSGETGLVIETPTASALATELTELLGSRQHLSEMRTKSRSRILENFCICQHAHVMQKLYQDVAGA